MADPFAKLLAQMAGAGVAAGSELAGCTPDEIAALESRYGVTLPATYRRFLEVMGRRSARLFTHDHVETGYGSVLAATADLRGQLEAGDGEESGFGFELPADALVVLSRDAEQYNFIRCDRPDDSPVWALDLGAVRVRPRRFRSSLVGWVRAWASEASEAVASGWYKRGKSNR